MKTNELAILMLMIALLHIGHEDLLEATFYAAPTAYTLSEPE